MQMKVFEHWKKKTLYTRVGETTTFDSEKHYTDGEDDKVILARHHETQELMRFTVQNNEIVSPKGDDKEYVLYYCEENWVLWAREKEDFYGFKELEDGKKIRRFSPV